MSRWNNRFSLGRSGPGGTRPALPLLSTTIALAIGTVVLLDLLTSLPLFDALGARLVEYGTIIAVFALMLGVLNVLRVHARIVQQRAAGWPYSLLLLLTTIGLSAVGLLGGPEGAVMQWTLRSVLLPLQAAFFSLLAFFLLGVAYRALRVQSVESLLFVASAILVILGTTSLGSVISPLLAESRSYLMAIPVMAGTRGLLLGIALGTIVTGLRLIVDGRRYFK